ncbi:hypothetical protein AMTR_s00071p00077390 [Amborella trichopoda]|uniref:Uncharacterized protein n=1 Tax=Amborella trichopoda TaxID=13333 RepID=U5DHF1_AMBTC|nr:hypothetical protein AMTR_s00071p00077390 [Amborella trichopoda]
MFSIILRVKRLGLNWVLRIQEWMALPWPWKLGFLQELRRNARIEKECEAKAIGFQRWYLGHVPVHHECISDELVMCISSDNGVPEKEARVVMDDN